MRRDVDDRLRAAVREIEALAARHRWKQHVRAEALELLSTSATASSGPREIAQRYRALVRSMGRTERAQTWSATRRVAAPGLRAGLDTVYRNEL
ncbi:MAG: hypothetical protein QOD51_420 [Candidatus Eremiobacteraeota bacterium]|jgi:hypothetical protein|nr:hypothetical protein [Candidatus Eremiobacteraeota bacterium]